MKRANIIAKGETTEQSPGVCLSEAKPHVQYVGYWNVVERIARKLNLVGFVEN